MGAVKPDPPGALALTRDALAGRLTPDAFDADPDPRRITATLLCAGTLGAMAFGAVTGSQQGGLQILSSAVKMPLVLVLPLVLCLPFLHWSYRWAGAPVLWSTLVGHGAVAVCRMGLGLLIGVPVVWIAWHAPLPHAVSVQLVAAVVGGVFLAALWPLFQLGAGAHRLVVVGLLAVTLGQSAWVLRPFVGDGERFRWFEDPSGDFVQGLADPMYRVPEPAP